MNLEDKVDKLKKETVALRKEMIIMKTLVKQQNEMIKDLLHKTLGFEVYTQPNPIKRDWFPIRTQEELDAFEIEVNSSNRDEIIYDAQLCLRHEGLEQNLNKILDEKLAFDYNLEGNYNKFRLLDYENLMDVLFKATFTDGRDHSKFIAEMRKGMRKIKKKQLKRNARRNLTEWKDGEDDDEEDNDDDGEDDDE